MARMINKLSTKSAAALRTPGLYSDGAGLFLNVGPTGAKSWVFRFSSPTVKRRNNPTLGQQRDMGIGPLHTIGLAEARAKAAEARRLILAGLDPIEQRRAAEAADQLVTARAMTFDQCAEAFITSKRDGWKNEKHADQWRSTLRTYASPVFGSLPVQATDTALVMRALQPIWKGKSETANRLRGRIEGVLNWATTLGYRQGENPARWSGHLANLLPKRSEVAKVKHHPALPYAELGGFMDELREQKGIAALALEFTILTAARTGEAIGATRDEFDPAKALWIVPAERIKGGKEHRVPLVPRALEILEALAPLGGRHVFPGLKPGRHLSNMSMLALLERMGRDEITVHGFRSSFRDWAAEQTNFPNELVEMALAHVVADKVEAAYRRGDMFDKRRHLMAAWAGFCAKPSVVGGRVVPLTRAIGAR
jgi:integrase